MIQLRKFALESFSYQNQEACDVLFRLNRDEAVCRNISDNFMKKFVNEPTQGETFEPDTTYVIRKDNERLGLVGTIKQRDVLDLWVALLPEYRHKASLSKYRNEHNGSHFLAEMTLYLLEQEGIEDVSVTIRNHNIGAQKNVEREGFTLYSKDYNHKVYRYFNQK